jgi:hypothetical protein
MAFAAPRHDSFFALQRVAILGSFITLASAINYTQMRLEIVFIPSVAAALGFSMERLSLTGSRMWLARVTQRTSAAVG